MTKPTDRELREFWEWCGIRINPGNYLVKPYWIDSNNFAITEDDSPPTADLNNLFKYAVPKLYELGYWMQWYLDSRGCDVRIHHLNSQDNYSIYQDADPALALYQALNMVRRKG